MVVVVAAVWLCVRVRAADGLSVVGVCAGLGVGCRALRWVPVASGGGVRAAHVIWARSGWRAARVLVAGVVWVGCARMGGGAVGGWA